VSDFLTTLRAEVLDAHAAHRRRGRARRAARRLAFTPRPALAAMTAAAALVVAVLAVRAAIPPPTGAPRVLDVIRLGGTPTDAVRAGDAVWVADFAGHQLVQLDASARDVARRVRIGGQPVAVADGPDGVWVRTAVGEGGAVGRIGGSATAQVGNGAALAAGSRIVWAADVELPPEGLHRIDADTTRDTGLRDIPGLYALATGGRALWAVAGNGTVMRLDGRTGEPRARWPAIAISAGTSDPALTADPRGAWVLRTGQAGDSQAIRLEGDRVVRRLPIPSATLQLLAQTPDGLWIVTEDRPGAPPALIRLNPGSGAVTARVALDRRNLTDLVAVGDDIWVVAGDGTVTVIGE
jgi:hypothetical protein